MRHVGIRRWISTGFKTTKQLEAEDLEELKIVNEERRLRGEPPLKPPKKEKKEGEAEEDENDALRGFHSRM
jgi:hypothetical protein